jgi:ATP-dependent DNA helicase RecQ
MLIDILRGSFKQEIQQQQFDRIKTFGVGRDVPFIHWRHFITQMINQGIISIDFSDYSRLKITPLSEDVLKNGSRVQLANYKTQEKKKKIVIPKIKFDSSNMDNSLLDRLKSWRRSAAKKQKVPAYIILNDKSLKQIASVKPETNAQLLSVDGIGQVKLEKYGEEILRLVRSN